MGLLSFLSKSKETHDVALDDEELVQLFLKHLETYFIREKLAKSFNYATVFNAVVNFEETRATLNKIKNTISPDIHTIQTEQKVIENIISEFSNIVSSPSLKIDHQVILQAIDKEAELRKVFAKMERIIELELQMINVLLGDDKEKTGLYLESDRKQMLLKLFELIFNQEASANALFNPNKYFQEDKKKHQQIMAIARSMILGQKIEIIAKTQADVFAEVMLKKLKLESKNKYHTLAMDIFKMLSELANWEKVDAGILIGRIEKYLLSDDLMKDIVKKVRPKFTLDEVEGTVEAFRKAYSEDHFEEVLVDIARKKVQW